ncbi:MAG: hypothetical protein JWM47_2486 [Acidimicrobiales bacterium]|nr:hypothetical protein [Acidimicrobiales bacterium]
MTNPGSAAAEISMWEHSAEEHAMAAGVAEGLRGAAGKAFRVRRGEKDGHWRIETSGHVGAVSVPGLRLLIRPKVHDANLFHLLGVSRRFLPSRASFDFGRQGDVLPAVATMFCAVTESGLAQGLVRRYRSETERMPAVRGRIEIAAQLQLAGLPLPLTCTYDEYTADIELNRVLLGAAHRLLSQSALPAPVRRRVAALASRFDGVGPLARMDLMQEPTFDRLSERFRVPYRLGRLILEGSSLTDAHGSATGTSFLIDMNKLFEEFVEERLRQALAPGVPVTGQGQVHLDEGESVRMRPDLIFGPRRTPTYVGDAKYKLTESGLGREQDYYQLLAYCTALGLHEGVLVYCRSDGEVPFREVHVRHTSVTLHTRPLSLDGPPEDVDRQMVELADWIRGRLLQLERTKITV